MFEPCTICSDTHTHAQQDALNVEAFSSSDEAFMADYLFRYCEYSAEESGRFIPINFL